ncbi:MAG: tetratricopeptide repeat protein [Flavisolibacter sp.]
MRLYIVVIVSTFSFLLFSCTQSKLHTLQKAEALAQKGKFDEAIGLCNEVLSKDSTIQLAYYYRGIYYSNKKEYSKAIADFDKVISLQPHSAGIYFQINRDGPAATEDDKLKITPEEALFQRAITEYIVGDLNQAEEDFNICLANHFQPEGKCYSWLGTIAIKKGNKTKGCELYTKAVFHGDAEAAELRKKNCE